MKVRTQIHSGWWYKVQPGETLYDIASRYYGDGNLWWEIYLYRSNYHIIRPNPDFIRPDMKIELW